MSREETLGVGIVGSGFMGRTYAETFKKYCGGCALKAVTGGSRSADLARDYGVSLDTSLDQLLARRDISMVVIATPHHLHADQALAAARAGKHILLEKPMGCTVGECDAILDTCEQAGIRCTIAFTQRTRVCNRVAKQWLDEGRIGRIVQMRETALVATGLSGLPKWQSEPQNLGTLFAHGVHNFDRVRWFTGQEIRTVFAKCGSTEPGTAVEGSSMVLMTLADGTMIEFWCSFQVPKPSFPHSQFATWIVGEQGLMDLDAYGELRVNAGGEWQVAATQAPIDWSGKGFLDPVRMESYALQCQDFIDAIRGNRAPAITGWDGRQAVAAALAAYESSKTGREILLC